MRATLWLFNKHFWRSIYGPIMAFVFPPLLLLIMGHIMNITYVLPGIISLAVMFIGVLSMPSFVLEMKGSTLLKYVGASPIDTKRFTGSVVLFYLIICVSAVFNVLLWGMVFFASDVFPSGGFAAGLYSGIFSAFGSFSFFIANVLHISLSLAIGLLIVTFSKTSQKALAIGLIIAIPSMFLSGMVLPVDIIAKSPEMQIISHFTPFRYSTGLLVVSSTPMPQLGDFLNHISPDNLSLIFNDVNPEDGTLNIAGIVTESGKYEVNSLNQLAAIMDKHKEVYGNIYPDDPLTIFKRDNVKDTVLFDQIFGSINLHNVSATSNNIFAVGSPWGVRKLPDVDVIINFMSDYLIGAASDEAIANGAQSLLELQARIGATPPDMSWLELFTEQTVILYGMGDMISNLVVPIVIPIIALLVAIKKFKWSSR